MNRSDLINQLKDHSSLSKKDAEQIINIFFSTISDTLAEKDRVEVRGFGSFTVKQYKPYVGRNPKSGQKISVPSKKLPFFKVGKELKDLVD
ncbi:MAG: integration host factor subunit beta, partial [Deltaproteobacteria bacterium RBG_13_49_15]